MNRRELLAGLLALVIGAPLVFMLARALADGMVRHEQGPVRSLLGNRTYERLRAGRPSPKHYLAPRSGAGAWLRAPDFTLPDRHGDSWTLREHRGKVVVLNFWTADCKPCIREMPSLDRLARMARRWDEVEVVSVSTDAGWNQVRPVLPEDPALRVLFDPDESVVEDKFGTRLYPETWIIDPRGIVRLRYDGAFDWASPIAVEIIRSFRG